MLTPRKVKYHKHQKGRSRGVASSGTEIDFGSYGLKALESKWVTARQLEAARRAVMRYVQRGGKIWIRIFPDKPVTKKGEEVGMGGGKGSVDHFVVPIKRGRIILEMDGVEEDIAREAIRLAAHKLPIRTKFITK